MLAQRLQRRPNISPALVQCLVLAVVLLDGIIIFSHFNKSFHQRPWMGFAVNFAACSILQTRGIHPMVFQCWPTVFGAGPTLKQYWVNAPCLLGCRLVVIVDQARCYGNKPFHYDDLT